MGTVADFELEQKTSEYAHFVREYFVANNKTKHLSKTMDLRLSDNAIILEYEGK